MEEFLQALNNYAPIISGLSAIASLGSVVLTGIYVFLTRNMVREMVASREAQLAPHMFVSMQPFGVKHARVCVQNIGMGPAHDVRLQMQFEPLEGTVPAMWNHRGMLPSATENFKLPLGRNESMLSLDELALRFEKFTFRIEYKDVLGKAHNESSSVDLKVLKEGWYNAGWYTREPTLAQQLGTIGSRLEGLGDIAKYYERQNRTSLEHEIAGRFNRPDTEPNAVASSPENE